MRIESGFARIQNTDRPGMKLACRWRSFSHGLASTSNTRSPCETGTERALSPTYKQLGCNQITTKTSLYLDLNLLVIVHCKPTNLSDMSPKSAEKGRGVSSPQRRNYEFRFCSPAPGSSSLTHRGNDLPSTVWLSPDPTVFPNAICIRLRVARVKDVLT